MPTIIVMCIGILINNARLTDVKEVLRATMDKNQRELLHRVGALDNRMNLLESRMTRLESGLG